jgi:hypothetical protein
MINSTVDASETDNEIKAYMLQYIFLISIKNIYKKYGSQFRVNILLCKSQNAAVFFFFLTVK